ncbi:hypothetical protein DesLBE_0307 [Desulfitobacterium sp. LBE]|nr:MULTISPECIES: hypothetical protein [Desulfitobacterium]EHL06421.1 hypothetical protein HMPREF0322_02901 [Desulfitobacterium hafniense DP7]KTE93110.1 hypothetical protein AT727_15360 [Desulfitobacterium hafniense]MEA5021871.1 hypothetical protein [Desulfitobacterium hafniense]TWH56119.1 hypothetical protein DesLBE_0307 [Desulfitobacterium sp. LBE]CDX01954.1 Hypothetical protein DPCES_2067 [Desulfitobacterium hafniense]
MPNSWGRPPRNELWQDIQALAFWVLIIGVGAFILFPNFFSDVYSRLTDPVSKLADTTVGTYDPGYDGYVADDPYSIDPYTNTTSNYLYSAGNTYGSSPTSLYLGNEVATGYWVLFVADGDFKQFSVTSEGYAFLLRLIERDQTGEGKNTLILAANGQIRKFTVTNEIYQIVTNMAAIETRAKAG